MSSRWHVLRDGDAVTLARHLPARFDVAGAGWLPSGDPLRLAHQIRQDLWRALQQERGFSPVVELRRVPDGWTVRAGGRLAARPAPGLSQRISDLIANPRLRARWITQARRIKPSRSGGMSE